MRAVMMIGLVLLATLAQAQETPDRYALVLQAQSADAFAVFQKALEGPIRFTVDPTLTELGGRITLQIDQEITAPATLTEAQWAAYLKSQWPSAMAKIAQQLKAGGYTLLGVQGGYPETSVQRVWGPERAIALRFTRGDSTITAHVNRSRAGIPFLCVCPQEAALAAMAKAESRS